ncbi:MAG TPA: serine/threonine-protein kinase [Vicinamibacterales bacterium]|nr:serine/threonine-protein kinase [Vicinamibacterales bacterium]
MDGAAVDPIEPAIARDDDRTTHTAVERIRERLESRVNPSSTLPPELIGEAARRLGSLGLVYSCGVLFSYFGRRALLTWSGTIDSGVRASDAIALAAVLMGLAVFLVSRRSALPPRLLVDLGLAFQVAGAAGIAAGHYWGGVPQLNTSLTMVPGECAWIIVYPLVVPNTPMRVLVSSLLAASMGPVIFAISTAVSATEIVAPATVASYVLQDYLAAAAAYAVARIVHRFNVRLKHAREIGSYELVERIAEGGMGEVWRARHRLLARPAALKLIRKDVLGSSQRVRDAITRRFEREAQDTARLGSTHTIDVYDFGVTEEGDFYYVMELLDGVSLERFVELFGPIEPARTVRLLAQVCHSLGEAHALGLVHRDIKPGNIFLCRLGPDYDFVKVLDFGLVKHLDSRAAQMLTVEGTTAGTPAYMAPEVALGRADADGRADLYSLGCVAYFLLTGQPVFAGDNAVATALAHVNEQPAPPSARSEFQIPPELDAVVIACLAKDPAARPASAADLACRLLETVPVDAWTEEAARAWWELHKGALTGTAPRSGDESAPDAAVQQSAPRRCWPRLDRRPVSQQLA